MRTLVRTARPGDSAVYPFTLNFNGDCARFPFIFEGSPVTSIGGDPAPSCLISARSAGDMAFRFPEPNEVRERFFRSHGIPPERVYSLVQVHSRDVFVVGDPENPGKFNNAQDSFGIRGSLPSPSAFARQGDGMVSFVPEAVLAVTVGDCLPVFLLDTERGFLAALHSGWKGTGIVVKALEIMRQAGTRPEAAAAVLGPCIQSCCYRVDEERAAQFEAEFGDASLHVRDSGGEYPLGRVSRQDGSNWYIALQAANARLLAANGVRHIAYCTDCTFTDDRLGSFRREGPQSYTRMIAMTGLGLTA